MQVVIAAVVVAPVLALLIGAVMGRVRVRSCCAVEATRDGRMSAAFADASVPPEPAVHRQVTGDRAAG